MDWSVTARLDSPHVRLYTEDRDVTAWFLLDLSPSVDFGTVESERLKRTVLIDFVTTLARLLTRRGNRVGAVFYGSRVERTIAAVPGACRSSGWSRRCCARRSRPAPRSPTWGAPGCRPAGLQAALTRVHHLRLHQRAGLERPLSLLNRRHDVLAVRLVDPREIQLPDVGPLIMQDAETGEQLYVDTHDRQFRRRFEEAAARREATVNRAFARAGVDAVSLSTDEDLVRAIVRIATLRRRRRRR